jgi:hypothetical protein
MGLCNLERGESKGLPGKSRTAVLPLESRSQAGGGTGFRWWRKLPDARNSLRPSKVSAFLFARLWDG